MPQDSTSNPSDDTERKSSEWETLPTKPAPGPPRAADLAGSFPHLEIIELLGQGGMGYVYKARQKGLDRLVALKLLPPEVSSDANFAERFAREARLKLASSLAPFWLPATPVPAKVTTLPRGD